MLRCFIVLPELCFFDQYATGGRCTCKTFPSLVCTCIVSENSWRSDAKYSFVLASSLLLLSRFDLIDGMLLVVRRGADVIEPNLVCFDKFGSNKKYSLLVLP